MNSSKEYNYSIEIIRLVGVILISFVHTRNDFQEGLPFYIFYEVPRFGTLILSLVSGFLYYKHTSKKPKIFFKKVRSLFIPYLVANVSVVLISYLFYLGGYNFLNRLTFDSSIITEGILSLNSQPLNVPTYFIRDLFVIFCIISLFKKEYWGLLFIIPLLIFGKLLLRYDILLLFTLGYLYSKHYDYLIKKKLEVIVGFLFTLLVIYLVHGDGDKFVYYFPFIILIFYFAVQRKVKFIKTGGYTYFFHLYHSPIIVTSFTILVMFVSNPIVLVITQVALAAFISLLGFMATDKLKLKFITGGR